MSVLSCGSTGLWSQWGDIQGRKFIFCVSIVRSYTPFSIILLTQLAGWVYRHVNNFTARHRLV